MPTILAVLMIYVAGGVVEVTVSPQELVSTVEECRAQLRELYAKANYRLVEQHFGPIERVTGECRELGTPA